MFVAGLSGVISTRRPALSRQCERYPGRPRQRGPDRDMRHGEAMPCLYRRRDGAGRQASAASFRISANAACCTGSGSSRAARPALLIVALRSGNIAMMNPLMSLISRETSRKSGRGWCRSGVAGRHDRHRVGNG